MKITMIPTAAAARTRALSTVSPFPQAADWYAQRPTQAPGMCDRSALVSLDAIHNSITANLRPAAVVGFGAAKQAAPPRGVPR